LEIRRSALKHGVAIEDIEHAMRNAVVIEPMEDGEWLFIGASRNATLLEVVTSTDPNGAEFVVHAMPLRRSYRRLLPGG
jgi:hypothetical protein